MTWGRRGGEDGWFAYDNFNPDPSRYHSYNVDPYMIYNLF